MAETVTIGAAELEALIAAALVASNTAEANARSVARALAQAEIDGQKGHGLSRVPIYAAQARAGKVDGHATPIVRQTRPGSPDDRRRQRLRLSGHRSGRRAAARPGAAPPASPRRASCARIISASSAATSSGWRRRACSRSRSATRPRRSRPGAASVPLFGTSPLAFAAPQRDAPPIVVDMALSQVARGKILTAGQRGEPIPADWAVDEHGKPTTDRRRRAQGRAAADRRRQGRGAGADGGGAGRGADGRALRLRGQLLLRCRGPAARRRPAARRHRSGRLRRPRALPRPHRRAGRA